MTKRSHKYFYRKRLNKKYGITFHYYSVFNFTYHTYKIITNDRNTTPTDTTIS